MSHLRVSQLNKMFKKQAVFKDADLTLTESGIYGLVAPNGYGKTTLLNMISGLSSYDSGEITIFDQSVKENANKNMSYLQGNHVLYPYLTGLDHLNFISQIHQLPKSRMDQIANIYEISDYLKKKVGKYSLGMKQRLLLAMAMMKEPKLLLLDEPLTGLDPTSTVIVREALLEAERGGATILISSHDLNELDKLTDTVFFIENKQLILETVKKSGKESVHVIINIEQVLLFTEMLNVMKAQWKSEKEGVFQIEVSKGDGSRLIKKFMMQGIDFVHFSVEHEALEELYKKKYTHGGKEQ